MFIGEKRTQKLLYFAFEVWIVDDGEFNSFSYVHLTHPGTQCRICEEISTLKLASLFRILISLAFDIINAEVGAPIFEVARNEDDRGHEEWSPVVPFY